MKKAISFLLAGAMVFTLFAGCSKSQSSNDSTPAPTAANSEIVDGKFVKTRSITVEVFDRNNDKGTAPDDNFYTKYIKEGMLRDHNVDVKFVRVPRWTETEAINNLLAAGNAPDVCVTYSYPTVQTYANMGGILDLSSHLEKNKSLLPNLWGLLGEDNINYNKDPQKGTIWAIEAKLYNNSRINTFVREDWLKKLNIAEPKTTQEFEAMLKAFKDNAPALLGANASKMIPFSLSFDVGWRANNLLTSYIPDKVSDKDLYVYGFDDRQFLLPGIKDGVKKLNQWYNDGLIWKDFALYPAGDKTEDNLIKAGYVGAFMHNWDYPYRDGDNGIAANLKKNAGEDAAYIAVDPFKNDAGVYRKFLSNPIDRKLFFPATNKEPVASLMYLDWISKLDNRKFLQIGEAGVTHEKQADGAIKTIAAVGEKIMNSPSNIDYTMTINGLDLGDKDINIKSMALAYAGVDKRFIEKAFAAAQNGARIAKHVNVGEIKAEEGQGEALKKKRDNLLDQAVVAKSDQFDAVYDKGYQDYLSSGGKAIIDERKAAYEKFYK